MKGNIPGDRKQVVDCHYCSNPTTRVLQSCCESCFQIVMRIKNTGIKAITRMIQDIFDKNAQRYLFIAIGLDNDDFRIDARKSDVLSVYREGFETGDGAEHSFIHCWERSRSKKLADKLSRDYEVSNG